MSETFRSTLPATDQSIRITAIDAENARIRAAEQLGVENRFMSHFGDERLSTLRRSDPAQRTARTAGARV